jgi:glucose/arabinose dehydrogenase
MRASRRNPAILLLSLGLLLAGCSGGDDELAAPSTNAPTTAPPTTTPRAGGSSSTSPAAASAAEFRRARVRLVRVATLQQPVATAVRPGDRALYVVEQVGRVRAIRNGRLDPTPVVDISSQVTAGGEQGLLGIAFSPDGRLMYLDFTDRNGDHRVVELAMRGGRADPGSQRLVLQVEDPYANHNGGQLAFGPDRQLYIAMGDGGSGGDPLGNGQSLGTLLGKLLRIDPRPAGGRPYRIPSDNPFSFDPATGDLWIGDVGQSAWEEVDFEPAGSDGGSNYGWNRREGRHEFEGDRPAGAVDPVIEYGRQDGCTVIGGFVYRGRRIPGLRGAYLYADYCGGWVRAALTRDGRVLEQRDLGVEVSSPSTFGVDPAGELYVASLSGPLYRIARA